MSDQRDGGIGWTDETWNPIRGCSRVSPGCEHCYAETMAGRFCGPGQPYEGLVRISHAKRGTIGPGEPRWTGEVRLVAEHLADPLRWRRPRRVFVNSMSDLFHEKLSDGDIEEIFAVMALAPRHTFQLLTKRAARMRDWFADGSVSRKMNVQGRAWRMLGHWPRYDHANVMARPWPLPNVWLGVSCEDRKRLLRLDDLRETPAAVRFVSFEPLLEDLGTVDLRGIDWAIVGAESGHGARPMEPDWARSLRDQCQAAGVAFFLKQFATGTGKKISAPMLDGRQWQEYP